MLISPKNNKTFTLGILGGGQLAKMLALAAYRMGLNIAIIENGENSPAGDMTKLDFSKGWFDENELMAFANTSDIVTLENEFISPEILDKVNSITKVFPSPDTMRLVQDKYIQKQTFSNAGIPVPEFAEINTLIDIHNFAERYAYPLLIKTRTLGYDGYGNYTVTNPNECEIALNKFQQSNQHRKLMAEKFIPFRKELAVMVVRSLNDRVKAYPCVETIQKNHICHEVIAPAEIESSLAKTAQELAIACVESIKGIGVFGVEFFLSESNQIFVNEIAPRPHNSGHYTIEACYTSQFENCIRAVCGLPLGDTSMVKPAACMINLLGERDGLGAPTSVKNTLQNNGVFLHLYNKKQSRKGRKMGHITALGETIEQARKLAHHAFNDLIW